MKKKMRNKIRGKLLVSQKNKCYWCKKDFNHVQYSLDHIVPLSRGGKNIEENFVLACQPCNSKRGNMWFNEYGKLLDKKKVK